ncbi:MAG: hypothetical protein JWL58_6986 [Streptosporangiaceae bacterium]|jgi:hypothetical protein|nr:hypothetical protein [Streptosporangiaceae bacterium]
MGLHAVLREIIVSLALPERPCHGAVRGAERSFSYRWQHPPGVAAGEGNSLLVEFTLTCEGDGTRLRVDGTVRGRSQKRHTPSL